MNIYGTSGGVGCCSGEFKVNFMYHRSIYSVVTRTCR